jgi:hypothetical protein
MCGTRALGNALTQSLSAGVLVTGGEAFEIARASSMVLSAAHTMYRLNAHSAGVLVMRAVRLSSEAEQRACP